MNPFVPFEQQPPTIQWAAFINVLEENNFFNSNRTIPKPNVGSFYIHNLYPNVCISIAKVSVWKKMLGPVCELQTRQIFENPDELEGYINVLKTMLD